MRFDPALADKVPDLIGWRAVTKLSRGGVDSLSRQYHSGATIGRPSGRAVANQIERAARSVASTVVQGMWPRIGRCSGMPGSLEAVPWQATLRLSFGGLGRLMLRFADSPRWGARI